MDSARSCDSRQEKLMGAYAPRALRKPKPMKDKDCDCCDRPDEYNGFASGPLLFVCPKSCMCHD